MKAVIIEDEKQAINALIQELADNCPEIQVEGYAQTVTDAIKLIEKVKPEIVFLDIQLKDGDGFDLLDALGPYDFKVIFTTAYSEYAVQAIKISALDYLLKPIDSEQLIAAVQKAKESDIATMRVQIQNLIDNQTTNPLKQKIALPTSKGISMHSVDTIVRIQAEGNYSSLYLENDKKIIVAKTLRDFEDSLQSQGFCRIHHSHIINLNHLESYVSKDGGYVILSNRETLPVSKRKKADLLKALNAPYQA